MIGIAHQGFSFLLVGFCLIFADWAAFVVLTALGVAAAPANVVGRVVGAILGFALNGWFTFGEPGAPRYGHRRFLRFVLLWTTLTLVSTLLVTALADHMSLRVAWLAKPIVEAGMAVLSFFASRHWVYR